MRGSFIPPDVQVFDASGTWYKPDTKLYTRAFVWVCSAGGGTEGYTASVGTPGGGGGGGVWFGLFDLAQLSATETATVGVGGTGVAGAGATGGGSSRFGTRHIAPGGGTAGALGFVQGVGGTSPLATLSGGGGGLATVGGAAGGNYNNTASAINQIMSGVNTDVVPPGSCVAGNGGTSGTNDANGGNGLAPGGGGGGSIAISGSHTSKGGDGANGRIVVICF